MEKETLSDKIRGLRSTKGYNQAYMATKLNITQKTYSAWENSADNLCKDKLEKICQILDTNIEKLKEENTTSYKEIFSAITELRQDVNLILKTLAVKELPPPLIRSKWVCYVFCLKLK